MKDHGVLVTRAEPGSLAKVLVAAHQGGGTMAFTYRQEWPLGDALRFGVNYLRLFAADPAERTARRPRRARRALLSHEHSAAVEQRFTRKGLATRARIVDNAARLIFKRGVMGTSLEDVRDAAGVSGSQIAHYFTDKRDLTRGVIAARADHVLTFHSQPQLGTLDTIAALHAWAKACIADVKPVYLRGGCIYGSLTGELLEADTDVLDDLAAGYEQWLEMFRVGIATMRQRGELTADADPRHLSTALVAAHQGGAMLTYAMNSAEPMQTAVTAAVDYVASFRASLAKPAVTKGRRHLNP